MNRAGESLHEKEADEPSIQTRLRIYLDTFSPKHFVLALLLIFVIHLIGSSSFPFIPAKRIVAISCAAIILGVLDSERRFLEIGAAGAIAGGAFGFMSPVLAIPLVDTAGTISIIVTSGTTGAVVALVFYFIANSSGR